MPSISKLSVCLLLLASCPLLAEESRVLDDEEWFDSLLGVEEEPWLEPIGGSESGLVDEAEVEEALEALRALTAWSFDSSAETGFGWRDNVLLEEDNPVDSAYVQAALDVFAYRPGLGSRPELLGLLYAEYRYFDDVPGLNDESLLMAQASAKRMLGEGWKGGLFFEGAHSEQAFDASVEEFVTEAATVRFWKPEVGISLEREFADVGRVSLKPSYALGRYDQSGENFSEVSAELDYSRPLGSDSELRLGVELYRESYDDRLARLSDGDVQETELLELEGRRYRGEWIYERSEGLLRMARTRLEYEREDDRVGDYYERDYWQGRQSVGLAWGKWELELAVSYGDLGYANRLAGPVSDETRADQFWRWDAELLRRLNDRWSAFSRVEAAEKDSNSERLAYESGSVLVGVSVSGIVGN